jgi:hypothetical protein
MQIPEEMQEQVDDNLPKIQLKSLTVLATNLSINNLL